MKQAIPNPAVLFTALALTLVVSACAATVDEDLPESLRLARDWKAHGLTQTSETPHIVFRYSPWVGVNERRTRLAEEHILNVAEALGVDPPNNVLYVVTGIEVSAAADRSEAIPLPGLALIPGFGDHPNDSRPDPAVRVPGAGDSDAGRVYDGIVMSSDESNLHELVHIVSGVLLSPDDYQYRSPLIFEGLAVAWDGRRPERMWAHCRELFDKIGIMTPSDLIFGFPAPDAGDRVILAYEVSGTFCAHLIETRGLDRFRELFRLSRKQRFHRVFEKIYGVTFETIEDEWADRVGLIKED